MTFSAISSLNGKSLSFNFGGTQGHPRGGRR